MLLRVRARAGGSRRCEIVHGSDTVKYTVPLRFGEGKVYGTVAFHSNHVTEVEEIMLWMCGARRPDGSRCRKLPMRGKRRCYKHGGKLTGGMRWADPLAAAANARAGHKRWLRLRHAMGLKHPGGRPPGYAKARSMVEKARGELMLAVDALREVLPAERGGAGSAAEMLGRAALTGLVRLQEAVDVPLTEDMILGNPKAARLIVDAAAIANRLFMRAAEGEFQRRKSNAIEQLLEEIAAERRNSDGS